MNLAVYNPNFSIVVPTGCNAKCKFCFWEGGKGVDKEEYLTKLKRVLDFLPQEFTQCSITGGEPTMLPWLGEILELVRKRFARVVLSTNGYRLYTSIRIYNNVDHINISRHSASAYMNKKIFGTDSVPSDVMLEAICNDANAQGVDVTLNCVVKEGLATESVYEYVQYAKDVGANAVCFRKEHSDLVPLPAEGKMLTKVVDGSECPVCRTNVMLIRGMKVSWKYSVSEPSNELDSIYELVMQPDGSLTSDWKGEHEIMAFTKAERAEIKEILREVLSEALPLKKKATKKRTTTGRRESPVVGCGGSMGSSCGRSSMGNSSCGGSSSCG